MTRLNLSTDTTVSSCLILIEYLLSIQSKVKRGTLSNFAFRPNLSAMATNDALDRCQSYPGANEFCCFVQALERLK